MTAKKSHDESKWEFICGYRRVRGGGSNVGGMFVLTPSERKDNQICGRE